MPEFFSSSRVFSSLTLGLALLAPFVASAAATGNTVTPVVLTERGSGRASAYQEQGKIITFGEKTHVVWLDAEADGFHVRGRTLDRVTGQWSPIVLIGEAQDNHGGPSLTVDSQGYLHIVYYPHHEPCRYRRSTRPNDLSAWEPEIQFGEGITYPSMICSPDDTLVLTARHAYYLPGSGDATRIDQELWKKPKNGDWRRESIVMTSRVNGYAQLPAALAWGKDGRTIHLSTRIYEKTIAGVERQTLAYMVSADAGITWAKSDGTLVPLPATADTMDIIAGDVSGLRPGLASGPLGVDAQGNPHVLYSAAIGKQTRLYLATPVVGLGWTRRDLSAYLPESIKGWNVTLGMGGGFTFSETGRATLVAVAVNVPLEERTPLKEWAHPTCEIVRLWSDDGMKTFQSEILAPVNAQQTHWLPNLEHPTGHNRVPKEPGIIYTVGGAGGGLKDLDLKNQVWWKPAN
ncbi:BNR-4 repeat-containing protein [Oleiharenicola lentus]|uniref:BNR-4 repeat-containing protein n=1 Tax=Oleiharenicola lentus TaxID=2508720 RepID=UPI003F678742